MGHGQNTAEGGKDGPKPQIPQAPGLGNPVVQQILGSGGKRRHAGEDPGVNQNDLLGLPGFFELLPGLWLQLPGGRNGHKHVPFLVKC